MPGADKKGVCFVIAPIGEEDTDTRRRSDQVLNHVIAPAAQECGYSAMRADQISEPGIITSQVIQHLVDDPLVIADLTEHNANVFYELAVRHAVRKPVVQIIQTGERIPFDVAGTRTIQLDHRDLDSVARCREEMVRQIRTVEKDVSQVDTPISVAIDLQSLGRSENPLEKSNAEIISMLQDLRTMLADSLAAVRGPTLRPGTLEEVMYTLGRLDAFLTLGPKEKATRQRFEEARRFLHRSMRVLEMVVVESGMPPRFAERMIARRHRLTESDPTD